MVQCFMASEYSLSRLQVTLRVEEVSFVAGGKVAKRPPLLGKCCCTAQRAV